LHKDLQKMSGAIMKGEDGLANKVDEEGDYQNGGGADPG